MTDRRAYGIRRLLKVAQDNVSYDIKISTDRSTRIGEPNEQQKSILRSSRS